jgi:AraC-like DNA-binding protein
MGAKMRYDARCMQPELGQIKAGQIRTGYLSGLSPLLRRLGADPGRLLARHGIDAQSFDDPEQHADCTSMARMLEDCSDVLNDRLFGFHLADCQTPEVFGYVTALARSAPSFRQALQSLVDYLPVLHSPEGDLSYVTAANVLEVRWDAAGQLRAFEQPNFHGFLLMAKMFQMLAGAEFRPRYITFSFALTQPALKFLSQRFGCRVLHASRNAIALPLDVLERRLTTSNRTVFEVLNAHLATMKRTPGSLELVKRYIGHTLSTRRCTIEDCAHAQGLSVRALQKRLARQRTSFKAVLQLQRAQTAERALCDRRQSLDDIAFALGYSDQTCFGRAFKEWTGLTPHAYRAKSWPL